ncbi:glycosyltransferase [Rubritalea tangerina]|uniref:Glycosyltransferase n=1 Tax=Rubritalea tangerina TaxID=430798 RepID=A0ABW4ZE48_9BACT
MISLLLVLLGALQIRKYNQEITVAEFDQIAQSDLTTPVSVIVPAFNEAAIIVSTVENVLKLNYPTHEVIVVDDGSTDNTIEVLRQRFNIQQLEKQGDTQLETNPVKAVYESADYPNLVVVSKENGQRADAINAAVNVSRYPLLCVIDADCVMDPDGLLHMVRPFLLDPNVAASSGVVRPSNGLVMKKGEIVARGLPQTWIGLNQEVEYARSFQWARNGLNRLHSMLCISGALLLIKKDVLKEVGGPWPNAITDDIEFTMRLHAYIFDRRNEKDLKIAFTPDAVCYTEVPEKISQYLPQRNRWQRGTLQAVFRNWRMIFNPRYGATGLFGMPYFLFFEALAPIVEVTAITLAVVFLLMGVTTVKEILILVFLAYSVNVFLTLLTIYISERSTQRSTTWKDYWKAVTAIFADGLGWHHLRVFVSFVATFEYFILRRCDLGAPMERKVASPPA